MRATLEPMPTRTDYVAVLRGPIVLAARTRPIAGERLVFPRGRGPPWTIPSRGRGRAAVAGAALRGRRAGTSAIGSRRCRDARWTFSARIPVARPGRRPGEGPGAGALLPPARHAVCRVLAVQHAGRGQKPPRSARPGRARAPRAASPHRRRRRARRAAARERSRLRGRRRRHRPPQGPPLASTRPRGSVIASAIRSGRVRSCGWRSPRSTTAGGLPFRSTDREHWPSLTLRSSALPPGEEIYTRDFRAAGRLAPAGRTDRCGSGSSPRPARSRAGCTT